jgi:uncharacterized protein (TIRG00374 family)
VVRRRSLPKPFKRLVIALVSIAVIQYLVLPQLAGTGQALQLLADVNVAYLLVGAAFQFAAIASYAKLTSSVLPATSRPPFATVLRVVLSTLGASHIVPGGSAAGAGLGYRLMTGIGVPGVDAAFAITIQGIGSAVVLNIILWLGLLVSIPLRGFNPLYGTAAIIGAVLLGSFAVAALLLTRGEAGVARVLCRMAARVPLLDPDGVASLLARVAERLRLLLADRSLLVRAGLWATANWLLDAASLWVFLRAFGHSPSIDALLVAFGLANVLAAIPLTPGGLGVVEAVLTSTLVGFGAPRSAAVLGIGAYRLINFWLPIPVGGVAYLSLRFGATSTREQRTDALREEAERAVSTAEDPRHWARERGIRVPDRKP